MRLTLFLFSIVLFVFQGLLVAQENLPSVPTPLINGINVLTGKSESPLSSLYQYEFEGTGENQKIKKLISKEQTLEFIYYPNSTEVIQNNQRKSVYTFTDAHLISSLNHFIKESHEWKLYRQECLYWTSSSATPSIASRVLKDGAGHAQICCYSKYNAKGKLVQETIFGNLSGTCTIPLIIQEDGLPLDNGIEKYQTNYDYALDDSDLLIKVSEDNGLFIRYFYDFEFKHCIAKLKGNQTKLLTRYFYEYDAYGCLSNTIIDDGQGYFKEDLTGVTCRKFMRMQSSHQLASYGQPILIENKYLDLSTYREITLDKMICTYSAEGELVSQQLYDAVGNLIQDNANQAESNENEAIDREVSFALENRSSSTDAFGNETTCFYDVFGRLIKMQLPAVLDEHDQSYHPTMSQEYNVSNQTSQVTDALGNVTCMTYTSRGKPASVAYSDGSVESFVYFLDGEIKEKINRNGTRNVVTRDDFGRIDSKQEFSAAGVLLNELFYTYQGVLVRSITDNHGFTINYEYDQAGREIRCLYETISGTKETSRAYDSKGQAIDVKSWQGSKDTHSKELQQQEQSVAKKSDYFKRELMVCNNRDQFVKQVESVDINGMKKISTFDALGRLENVIGFDSFGIKISEQDFRYDAHGRKIVEKHAKLYQGQLIGTFTIKWEYDAGDRLIAIHEGVGSPLQKNVYYQYNCQGQLLQLIKPNGTTLYYSYNEKGLLDRLEASDGSVAYQYAYDEFQRLINVKDELHATALIREFDAFNQLLMESDGTNAMHYEYNALGQRIAIILPDQSGIQYNYNADQLLSVERWSKDQARLYAHHYSYDAQNGQLQVSQLIKNIGKINYQYDAWAKLKSLSSPWWSEVYASSSFDEQGRLISRTICDPLGKINTEYTYSNGQLVDEVGEQSKKYSYDSLYNQLGDGQEKWIVNEMNQLIGTPDMQLIYDNNGNLSKKIKQEEVFAYSYDALGRLTRFETEQKNATEYQYDAFNRRIAERTFCWNKEKKAWQSESSYKYLYDNENEIGKLNSQNELLELRVLGLGKGAEIGAAIAIELQNKVYAPIHDTQGSVRCLIDSQTGEIAEFYRYNAFGQEEIFESSGEKVVSSSVENYWRYCSKRVDQYSNQVFFGLRYYDSEIGRWTTPDPLFFVDTPNVYAFVKNDPLNNYDLYGLFSVSDLWNSASETLSRWYQTFKFHSNKAKQFVNEQLSLPRTVTESLDNVGRKLIGDWTTLLFGYASVDAHIDSYGEIEISDKVRVTFINGVLTNHKMLQENLDLISKSHGGVKVHYVFRGTKGWSWDMWQAVVIKTCYYFGHRSEHAYLLAETWRELIVEMGGVNGGGVIIHYAHSLGGSVTDRARTLLTPEEQKMIRVFTIGSATMIENEGFQNVVNIISINDGVCYFTLMPFSSLRNYFNPNSNVRIYGNLTLMYFGLIPIFPLDHSLRGFTYQPIILQLGKDFLEEFG